MSSEQPWWEKVVEAKSYDAYYCCFDASTPNDPDPNATYERDYRPLERRIAEVLRDHGVPAEAMRFFEGWCRNRTRHVTCEARYVTAGAIAGLAALLRRRYEFWRIEVILVRDVAKDDEQGMIAIHKNWVLCYRSGCMLVKDVKRIME